MSDRAKRIADLPPDKLKLLLQKVGKKEKRSTATAPIPRQSREADTYPLSFAQQRMWFLNQFEPDNPSYNLSTAFRLPGALNIKALQKALTEIVRRHEILRTAYKLSGGAPAQIILKPEEFPLRVIDLRAASDSEREGELLRLATEEARRQFDLAQGDVFRAVLFRLSDEEQVLLVALHHIVFDAWSMTVLITEIMTLYRAFDSGQSSPLAELPIQYVDYAVWQRQYLQGDLLKSQLDYWKKKLSGVPVLELPADRPRPKVQTFRGAHQNLSIGRELTAGLKSLAEKEGATLFMTLLAAFDVLLLRYTGQEDISVGTPISGRNRVETEGLIGFFVNTLVMRVDAGGNPSFREMLRRVKEVAREAYAKQDVPFEKIVEEVQPERDLSHTPLFQVMLQLKNSRVDTTGEGGFSLATIDIEKGRAQCDFTLEAMEADGGIATVAEYNIDLFDDHRIKTMLGHFRRLLESVVADPDERIGNISILTPTEREQVLVEWNDTKSDYPADRCIHELFEAQVERTPEAVALVFQNEKLTYRELNDRANRLAHYLRGLGVRVETRVGICVERSIDMIVGMLAVLKAGGAYVPLDPAYPTERLAFVLEDGSLHVLLTQTSLRDKLPEQQARTVYLDADWEIIGKERADNPASGVKESNLAYVIYTSGSTGRPKGVAIEHRSAALMLNWAGSVFAEQDRTGVLASTSICFDLSVFEIFVPLSGGGKVILAENALHLPNLPAANEVTLVNTVPSAMTELLKSDGVPASVRTINLAGEPLQGALVRRIYEKDSIEQVFNLYGPSEDTTYSTFTLIERSDTGAPTIGRPIASTQVYLLDAALQPVPVGVPGELHLGGSGLARGYLNRPDLTSERFIPDPFSKEPGSRLYRTGDLARYLPSGEIEFLGRIDHQVKLRGYRIELGEIESALCRHPRVLEAAVLVREDVPGDKRLVAYFVPGDPALSPSELRAHLRQRLPEYMVPSAFVELGALPLTPNGKLDRKGLAAPEAHRPELETHFVAPEKEIHKAIAAIWQEALRVEQVGIHDNFFDLGGHSLLIAQVHSRIEEVFGKRILMVELFKYPTIHALAAYLSVEDEQQVERQDRERLEREKEKILRQKERVAALHRGPRKDEGASSIAIVGMTCRFPGAGSVQEFWQNLRDGVESITFFSEEELIASGLDAETVRKPNYVKAAAMLENIDMFDASFFGFNPKEAEITDPQHRLFLECAWEALEGAGYDPGRYEGAIGVYAGVGSNTYLLNVYSNPETMESIGGLQTIIGNDKDFLPTRVSYQLNLKGPSLNVQTACSTSLVAVHLACQSLLNYQCDMALAGGVSADVSQKAGYLYQEGGVASPDGHCRAFDARSQGSIFGNGVGVVILKRLADAIADRDVIHAVIKGSAINNDGSAKVGYTAPSVDGQSSVIAAAQALAEVEPETIGYIETHGTGTALGDPIEVAALAQVFRASTDKKGFAALGSVKTNFGHLRAAAGVAGLIKTVLAIKNGAIPPSLHFEEPNPQVDFDNSPFYVNNRLAEWSTNGTPRRAGVSSFGIGGTNAHVILEEPPALEESGPSRPSQLILLSAKTDTALEAATDNLADYLLSHPEANLADVAYTTQVGRKAFDYRRALVCESAVDASGALESRDPRRVLTGIGAASDRTVAFMFPGLGDHYVDMAKDLYLNEPVFREEVDRCAEFLKPILGLDLREVIYPHRAGEASNGEGRPASKTTGGIDLRKMLAGRGEPADRLAQRLNQTEITQPAVFVIEYATSRLLTSWGISPEAMIGYSLGEYVAACLAGVFSLEDALTLVAERARMIQQLPAGAMLAVPLPEAEAVALLADELSLAAINGPSMCVLSGPVDAITELEERLQRTGVACRRLQTSHAFHSKMLEPIASALADRVSRIEFRSPRIPFISNVTGTWITASQATDPGYWARHLCRPVRFSDGLDELSKESGRILLEVGPGQTLGALAKQNPGSSEQVVLPSIRHSYESQSDESFLMKTLGRLWLEGLEIDWPGFYAGQARNRVELPTYPFERQRYWIEVQREALAARQLTSSTKKKSDIADWFYLPSWKRASLAASKKRPQMTVDNSLWLFFADEGGFAARVAERVRESGCEVITVIAGDEFACRGEDSYCINPAQPEDYNSLFKELRSRNRVPKRIAHLWTATVNDGAQSTEESARRHETTGFYSLLYIAQAIARQNITDPLQITAVSTNMQEVTGEEELCPEKAMLLGPCKVIPQEYVNVICRSVDLILPAGGASQERALVKNIASELLAEPSDLVVAYRGNYRWAQSFEPVRFEEDNEGRIRLKERSVYLITGGLGGVGLILAGYLAEQAQARLVLVGRSGVPSRDEWEQHAASENGHDATSKKIRALLELERKGAEVLVLSADVADEQQMRAAIDRAYETFGRIDGVIHAAGIVGQGSFSTIQDIDRAECERQFSAKVEGLSLLARLIEGRDIEFCVLLSSLSSVLGGLGFVAYSAANIFMDAFAHKQNRASAARWISGNWDGWRQRETGEQNARIGASLIELSMTPAEGAETFHRVLSEAATQVVVSTGDLQARIDRWVRLESLRDAPSEADKDSSLHARPRLQTPYVAPRNELERTIAEIWQNLLGIEQVGIHDNFLELGGHSLLATQLITRLREAFHLELALRKLFEAPTVAQLAEFIEQPQRSDSEPARAEISRATREGRRAKRLPDGSVKVYS